MFFMSSQRYEVVTRNLFIEVTVVQTPQGITEHIAFYNFVD